MVHPVHFAFRLVNATWFEYFIIGVIIANGIILGLETSSTISRLYGDLLYLGNDVALGVFIAEARSQDAGPVAATAALLPRRLEHI